MTFTSVISSYLNDTFNYSLQLSYLSSLMQKAVYTSTPLQLNDVHIFLINQGQLQRLCLCIPASLADDIQNRDFAGNRKQLVTVYRTLLFFLLISTENVEKSLST